ADDLTPHRLAEVEPVRDADDHRVEERLQRFGREDLVTGGNVRDLEPRPAREVAGPAAGRVHDGRGRDRAFRGEQTGDLPVPDFDPVRLDAERDLDAERTDRLVDAPECGERVEQSVALEVRASHRGARGDPLDELSDPVPVQHLRGETFGRHEGVDVPKASELALVLGEEQVSELPEPDVEPELEAEATVRLHRLAGEPDRPAGLPLLAYPAPVATGRPARKETAVDDEDRSAARPGEMVGCEETDDPGPDHDGPVRVPGERHGWTSRAGGFGREASGASGIGTTGGRWVMYPSSAGGRSSRIERRRSASGRQYRP